jgi:glycosyltransferase involved in cell wall biosynthesis
MLDVITPVLLTYNEEQNIGRTLSRLVWARDVVVVDSGSTDRTLAILQKWPNVRVFKREFDSLGNQWRYAVEQTHIATDWILRLDADYQMSDAFLAELAGLDPDAPISAYRARFDYAVFSHGLLTSLYPKITVLLRKGQFVVRDKGHTETWDVNGGMGTLSGVITHDDWKTSDQWLLNQTRYMRRELDYLRTSEGGLKRWLRLRPPLMPLAIFFYCLFGKGLFLNGRAGIFYALQRLVAESVLSLMVLEETLRSETGQSTSHPSKAP